MISRFHKTEFYTSILIFAISIITYMYVLSETIHLRESTMDINIHDTYYLFSSIDFFTLILIFGIISSLIIFILSLKKFKAFSLLLLIFTVSFSLFVYSTLSNFVYSTIYLPDLPKRYYTNSVFPEENNFRLLIIISLLISFLSLLILIVCKLLRVKKKVN